jgi:hypothetical protein
MRRGLEDSERRTLGVNLAAGLPHCFTHLTYGDLMLIRLDDTSLIDDLCAHYRRSGFQVEPVGGGMVDIGREGAPTPEQERHEILLHLRVWEAVNPDVRGELLQ